MQMNHKILSLFSGMLVCSLTTAYTMVDINNKNRIKNDVETNSINITNNINNNTNSINTLQNNSFSDTPTNTIKNTINIVNNSANKVTISKAEMDKFLQNYKENPIFSSVNVCLQMSSLVLNQQPEGYEYFLNNIDDYFNKKDITVGIDEIIKNCFIEQDYSADNTPLMMAILYAAIDEYIKSSMILSNEKIDEIINRVLLSINEKIQTSITERESNIGSSKIRYIRELDNIFKVLHNNITVIQKLLHDNKNTEDKKHLNNEKDRINNIKDVISDNLEEMDNILSIRVKKNIKRNIINIKKVVSKKVLGKQNVNLQEIKSTVKDNIEKIKKKLVSRITDITNLQAAQPQKLKILNKNKEYISDTINYKNIFPLINKVQNKIKDYDLYNIINKTIKGVNYIFDLQEKKHYKNNNDKYRQTIYTLSNNNCKCWFMAAWELIRTILAQEYVKHGKLPKDLKNSNFAKFDNYLCNKNRYNDRTINTDKSMLPKNTINYFKEANYYNNYGIMKTYDLTSDRTSKSNIYGNRIDLLSELILWEDNNKWSYEINERDKEKRTATINLLRKLQDVNFPNHSYVGFPIIMNIFPELKNYIGNKLLSEDDLENEDDSNGNSIINEANDKNNNQVLMNNNIIQDTSNNENNHNIKDKLDIEENNINNKLDVKNNNNNNTIIINNNNNNNDDNDIKDKIDNKNNKKDVLFSNTEELTDAINAFMDDNPVSFVTNHNSFQLKDNFATDKTEIFNKYTKYNILGNAIMSIHAYDCEINNSTPYLLLNGFGIPVNDIANGYKFISNYDDKGNLKAYELIGMQLSNAEHAVCFAKKGKADNSWCGIDSNRNANDNNYKLEDIIYKDNTYLAKVYANRESNKEEDNKKKHPYYAYNLLYKKLSSEELPNVNVIK